MSNTIYKDYIPANARIIIDYKSNERVKFSYPREWTYKKAVWRMGYLTVASFWAQLHLLPFLYLGMYIVLPYIFIKYTFFPYTIIVPEQMINFNFYNQILPSLGFAFYFFGIPALFILWLSLDKERASKWIPKIGCWLGKLSLSKKEINFKSEDVNDNKVIIPVFSNMFLDYKAKKDFSKYLDKVEILEIPFKYIHRRFLFPFLKKEEKNDYVFRAVFHFSQKPKTGSMEVEFV